MNLLQHIFEWSSKNRKIIFYALLLTSLALLIFTLQNGWFNQVWLNQVVQAAIAGIVASVLIALLAHLDALIESRKNHELTQNQISLKLDETHATLYEKIGEKIQAKYQWGLHGIVEDFTEEDRLDSYENAKIKWLNTKFQDVSKQRLTILSAINRGCKIKILLMHPESDLIYYRGAYTSDNYNNRDDRIKSSLNYREEPIVCINRMIELYDEVTPQAKKSSMIKIANPLEIRFYMDSPAIPMLLVKGQFIKDGYTGFYLNSFSRLMPYLKWGGKEPKMVDHLLDYFDRKWLFAEKWDVDWMKSNIDRIKTENPPWADGGDISPDEQA